MTEPTELLRKVGAELDRIGCERFTTGSVASMIYGEPRFTNDIDIVVRLSEHQARCVAEAFTGDEWYVSEAAALDAVRRGSMFNIIHVPSGLKVDLIVASNSDFNTSRFSRVRKIRIARELHARCEVSPPIAPHFLPAPPAVSVSAARRLVILRTFVLIVSSFV